MEQKSTDIVDDAIDMLDRLVDSVHQENNNSIGTDTEPILTVTEVVELLDDTPGDSSGRYPGMKPVTDDQRSSNSLSE